MIFEHFNKFNNNTNYFRNDGKSNALRTQLMINFLQTLPNPIQKRLIDLSSQITILYH